LFDYVFRNVSPPEFSKAALHGENPCGGLELLYLTMDTGNASGLPELQALSFCDSFRILKFLMCFEPSVHGEWVYLNDGGEGFKG